MLRNLGAAQISVTKPHRRTNIFLLNSEVATYNDHLIAEDWDHSIPESKHGGVEGPSGDPPAQPPAQAGSPRAGCTGPHPAVVGISPEKETPQPLWAAWARAPSPSEGRSFTWI